MSELGPLVLGIGKAVWQVASVGDESQRARAAELLAETRRRLYGILAEDAPESDEELDDSERIRRIRSLHGTNLRRACR